MSIGSVLNTQRAFLFQIILGKKSSFKGSQLAQAREKEELNKNFKVSTKGLTEKLARQLENGLKETLVKDDHPLIFLYNNQSLYLILLEQSKLKAIRSSKTFANEMEEEFNNKERLSDVVKSAVANYDLESSEDWILRVEDLSVNKKLKKSRTMRALSGPLLKLFKRDNLLDPDSCTVVSISMKEDLFWEYWTVVKNGGKTKDFFSEKVRVF